MLDRHSRYRTCALMLAVLSLGTGPMPAATRGSERSAVAWEGLAAQAGDCDDAESATPVADPVVLLVGVATVWSDRTSVLGTLGGPSSIAYEISNAGHVVGEAKTVDGKNRGFRWTGGRMTQLGVPIEGHSIAFAVNDGRRGGRVRLRAERA